jgi:hypothetical protein
MRFSPLLSLIDEYTFYVYHRAGYDRGFIFLSKLFREWTESKWLPPYLGWID